MTKRLDPQPPRGVSRILGLRVLPAAGLAGAVLLAGLGPRSLQASAGISNDPDADGLVNAQETSIGTRPNRADTDGDGYTDAEEIARHSPPLSPANAPLPSNLDLGMTARGEEGLVHLVVAVYANDGITDDKVVDVGVFANGRMLFLPTAYLSGIATVDIVDASHFGAKVAILDVPFGPGLVHNAGVISIFATVSIGATGAVVAADAVTLVSSGGVIFQQVDQEGVRGYQSLQGGTFGVGSVYRPIPPGGENDIPATWNPGQICFQSTQIVGVSGAVVTHEVVAADCVDGWDAYCREDCQSSIGSTFQTIDPSVLVGN